MKNQLIITIFSLEYGISNIEDIESIIRQNVGLDIHTLINGKDVERLLSIESIKNKVNTVMRDCLKRIVVDDKQSLLDLELQVCNIIAKMSDKAFVIDRAKVVSYLSKLQEDIKGTSDIKNREKIMDKYRRIPQILYKTDKDCISIRSNIRSFGTVTGRITTNHFNIQGFPKEIRKCLMPQQDLLIEYDITASHLTLISYLSGEDTVINKLKSDVYVYIASIVLNKSESDVDDEQRKVIKKFMLILLNGGGDSILFETISGVVGSHISVNELRKRIYHCMPKIFKYIQHLKTCEKLVLGDVIINLQNVKKENRLSYSLQMLEAIILKKALIMINNKIDDKNICLYLTIHDSIILDVRGEYKEQAQTIVKDSLNESAKTYLPQFNEFYIKEEIINAKY